MRIRTTLGLIAATVFAGVTLATGAVQASQSSKNTWRNIGIGSAALAGVGLLTHNSTATLLGAGGAAYSASRYEHDRHTQARRSARYHRRHHHYYAH